MENQHTQGAWEYRYPKNVGSFEITLDDIVSIASVYNCYDNLVEQEANAKLIAAAPELLDALQDILQANSAIDMQLAFVNARQATKKATE